MRSLSLVGNKGSRGGGGGALEIFDEGETQLQFKQPEPCETEFTIDGWALFYVLNVTQHSMVSVDPSSFSVKYAYGFPWNGLFHLRLSFECSGNKSIARVFPSTITQTLHPINIYPGHITIDSCAIYTHPGQLLADVIIDAPSVLPR